MSKLLQRARNVQAAQARNSKIGLLPIPCAMADDIALKAHLALDILKRGQGRRGDAQILLQTMVLVGRLVELGYGSISIDVYEAADAALGQCFQLGEETDDWLLDGAGYQLLCQLVTVYDCQIHRSPRAAILDANNRLERAAIQAQESCEIRDTAAYGRNVREACTLR